MSLIRHAVLILLVLLGAAPLRAQTAVYDSVQTAACYTTFRDSAGRALIATPICATLPTLRTATPAPASGMGTPIVGPLDFPADKTQLRPAPAGAPYQVGWSPSFPTTPWVISQAVHLPTGPAQAIAYLWDVGRGQSPAALEYSFAPQRRLYVAFWLYHNAAWEFNPSNTNKIVFVGSTESPSHAETFLNLRTDRLLWFCLQDAQLYRAPYNVKPVPDHDRFLPPNIDQTPLALGQWHFVEVLLEGNTTGFRADTTAPMSVAVAAPVGTPNGRVRWWVDHTLRGDHQDVRFASRSAARFNAIVWNAVWGGGGVKSRADTLAFATLDVRGP